MFFWVVEVVKDYAEEDHVCAFFAQDGVFCPPDLCLKISDPCDSGLSPQTVYSIRILVERIDLPGLSYDFRSRQGKESVSTSNVDESQARSQARIQKYGFWILSSLIFVWNHL